jgi:glycine cleavage system H protein
MNPDDVLYTESHEWVRRGETVTVGITAFAQEQLGDVVYVDLPQVGATLTQGDSFGSVESVKTVSDLYAPLSGTVTAVNTQLATSPELVNSDPYGEGWLVQLSPANSAELDSLLDRAAYEASITQ